MESIKFKLDTCFVALSLALLSQAAVMAAPPKADTGILRTIKFPDKSIGSVYLATSKLLSGRDVLRKARRVAVAMGSVSLKVKKDETVLVDLNQDVFMHPEVLNQVSEHGIDRMRFAYCALDDNFPVHCDDALKYLPHFKDLMAIDLDRSDATDKGLAFAKSLHNLRAVSAFATDITGTSFKSLQSCPNLNSIETDHCGLDLNLLNDLVPMKNLNDLKMRQTGLTNQALVTIAKCSGLTSLDIGTNARINDRGIGALKKLRNLKSLELKGTNVTLAGIKQLKDLPLDELSLPTPMRSREEQAQLQKLFPKVSLDQGGAHIVSDDEKKLFAPLR